MARISSRRKWWLKLNQFSIHAYILLSWAPLEFKLRVALPELARIEKELDATNQ